MPGEKGEEECSYIFTKTNAGVCLSSFAARSTRKSIATRKSLSKFLENGILGNLRGLALWLRQFTDNPTFQGNSISSLAGHPGRGIS
jgi:hypothetical protein